MNIGKETIAEIQNQVKTLLFDNKTEIKAYTVQFIGGKGDARRDEDPPSPTGTPKPPEFGHSPSGGADDDLPF